MISAPAAGELLFGKQWQRPLARAVRRDAADPALGTGQYPLQPRHLVFHRLRRTLQERAMTCAAEAEYLDRRIDTARP